MAFQGAGPQRHRPVDPARPVRDVRRQQPSAGRRGDGELRQRRRPQPGARAPGPRCCTRWPGRPATTRRRSSCATDTQRAVPVGSSQPGDLHACAGREPHRSRRSFTLPASSGDTDYARDVRQLGRPPDRGVGDPADADRHRRTAAPTPVTSPAATPAPFRRRRPSATRSIVPSAGKKDLDVSLSLANDPNIIVDVVLIDPNGELADVGSNLTFNSSGQLFARAWTRSCSTPTRCTGDGTSSSWCRTRSAVPRSRSRSAGHVTFDQLGTTRATGLPNSREPRAEGRAAVHGHGARAQHRRAGHSRSAPTRGWTRCRRCSPSRSRAARPSRCRPTRATRRSTSSRRTPRA